MKKLKTMGESGVERVGEGLESVGFLVCGGAAGGGRIFVARWWSRFRAGGFVALWSVSGAERVAQEAEAARLLCGAILEAIRGRFEIPRSDAQSRQQGRALRVFAAWCLLAVACGISRAEARTMTRILSRWREK